MDFARLGWKDEPFRLSQLATPAVRVKPPARCWQAGSHTGAVPEELQATFPGDLHFEMSAGEGEEFIFVTIIAKAHL